MDVMLPTAGELLTQDYLTVSPSLPLLDAVGQLERHAEDTAFVVDESGAFKGVLTEKDCLRALAARAYDGGVAETVQDVMTPPKSAVGSATDAYAVAQAFLECSCGMLPVVDEGRVAGAVSQITMLRTFLGVFGHQAKELGTIEQTADDMKGRPETKEQMQRVSANLDRDQLATLSRRGAGSEE
ncbi:hypothetical protein BH24ACI4_BH24ACI4_09780 [soil metagenome]